MTASTGGGGTKGLTPDETKKAETKMSKVITRLVFGSPMILFFFLMVWLGHPYMVFLVCALQVGLFRELVNVKYDAAKEKELPLFRTQQWCLFGLAMYYVWCKAFVRLGLVQDLPTTLPPALGQLFVLSVRYQSFIIFSVYVAIFVTFVLTLQQGCYRYQISNFGWTIAVLMLIVAQLRGTATLIFDGLFWFMLPCGLVVANDCFAYFCGMAMGKKLIKAPFLALSPNKTWEGFIGSFFCTVAFAWVYSGWISGNDWFVCPQQRFESFATLDCDPPPVFQVQKIALPFDDLTLFTVEAKPAQLHAMLLACFASVVAPFGGFLASAIKRAYNIKDFDSLIPGHGGFMDRMDCQFIMLLCTYVHYRNFIQPNDYSHEHLLRIINDMVPGVREQFMARLLETMNMTAGTCH